MTYDMSEDQTSLPWISSAADSLAKMCPAQARARVLLANARDCGVSLLAWSPSFGLNGSSSKTLPVVRGSGSTRSCSNWSSKAMRVYQSRCRHSMSALRTSGSVSSLLPTLTETGNLLAPSMEKWSAHKSLRDLLPTLTASSATRGRASRGKNAQGGPSLQEVLLPTLTVCGRSNSGGENPGHPRPSLQAIARLLPTLTARDEKGIGPKHSQGGQDLPRTLGGHLSPSFCEWLMGFLLGWTAVGPASPHSATRSSRSVQKSSAG